MGVSGGCEHESGAWSPSTVARTRVNTQPSRVGPSSFLRGVAGSAGNRSSSSISVDVSVRTSAQQQQRRHEKWEGHKALLGTPRAGDSPIGVSSSSRLCNHVVMGFIEDPTPRVGEVCQKTPSRPARLSSLERGRI